MADASPHRFIVPLKGVNTFCTFRDGELVPENPLPMVGFDGHAIDPEFGWVAWVADSGKAIGRTHLDAIDGEGGFAPLPMPEGYTAGCLLFHRQVLFVGGNCGTEVLGRFDFASPEPKWAPLEVPKQFRRHGKRVDDLLLDGDRLIAIDNCIEPKYLLLYGANDPRKPKLVQVHELRPHGTYEDIHRGALGTNWVALLSSTMGRGGSHRIVSFHDRSSLGEYGSIAVAGEDLYTQEHSGRNPADARTWNDIAMLDDVLLIAADSHGVGVLDLVGIPRPTLPLPTDWFAPGERMQENNLFSEQCQKRLTYIKPQSVTGPWCVSCRCRTPATTSRSLTSTRWSATSTPS